MNAEVVSVEIRGSGPIRNPRAPPPTRVELGDRRFEQLDARMKLAGPHPSVADQQSRVEAHGGIVLLVGELQQLAADHLGLEEPARAQVEPAEDRAGSGTTAA